MVFVRVHLMNKRLNTAQKEELGAKLVQAVSEGMDLVNNHTAKETAWVQFYEFDPRTGMPQPMSPVPTPTPESNST